MEKLWKSIRLYMLALIAIFVISFSSFGQVSFDGILLKDQQNNDFRFANAKGQYSLISFVYTSCRSAKMCPLTISLNQQVYQQQDKLKTKLSLHSYIVTLDPLNDTPEVMKHFGESRKLDPANFTLLSGDKNNVADLLSYFSAAGHPGTNGIDHTPTTILLDPQLREVKTYSSNNWIPTEIIKLISNNSKKDFIDNKMNWKTYTYTLNNFKVDKAFLAMSGPTKQKYLKLPLEVGTKRFWIKAMGVEVLNSKTNETIPLSYLCHAWLSIKYPINYSPQQGVLTISEGMGYFEFPKGFGMVSDATANLELLAQALNEDPHFNKELSYKFTISYIEEKNNVYLPLRPLKHFILAAKGPPVKIKNGAICDSSVDNRGLATHFLVKPGKQKFTENFPKGYLKNGYIHFIKLHLHKFGQSVSLIDTTAKKVLWKGMASYKDDQIDHTDYYSSEKGIEIFPDHEYKVEGQYNNPTNQVSDGMAVLRLYVI